MIGNNHRAMRRRTVLAALSALLARPSVGAPAEGPVRIGFSIAQSGLFAKQAEAQTLAYEFWRDQTNEAGGLDVGGTKRAVEFIWYDDQSSPGWAERIYQHLIAGDRVDLLLAPWGGAAHLAIAPVLARHGYPLVATAAPTEALQRAAPGLLHFVSTLAPARLAEALVGQMTTPGIASIAIITNPSALSVETHDWLLPLLDVAGIKVVVDEAHALDAPDLTATLVRIEAAEVDAVIALTEPADGFLYMAQARDNAIMARLQVVMAGPALPAFVAAFGDAAEGIVTAGQWDADVASWPKAKPFEAGFTERFGTTHAVADAALAYASCEITAQALAEAGLDRFGVATALATGVFDTVAGPVRFEGGVNVASPAGLLQIQGGRPRLIWPPDRATARYRVVDRSVFTPLDEPVE